MEMNTLVAMFGLGGQEIILILVVILLLFGAKKIPELARGLGTGIKEFKKATETVNDEIQKAIEEEPKKEKIVQEASHQSNTSEKEDNSSPKA